MARGNRVDHVVRWLGCVVAIAAAVLVHGDANAGGFGLYNEGEFTRAELDRFLTLNTGKVNRDFEQGMWGIGFSYDTNVARDTPWNYRFKVGYRHGERKYDENDRITVTRRTDSQDPDEITIRFVPKTKTVNGFTFAQTLGYGFLRDPDYRLWAGPSFRLNVDWQDIVTDLDTVDVSVGGGPEFGVNYHLSDRWTVAGSVAYNFMYLSQSFEVTGKDRKFEGYQHEVALTLTFFWRTENDRFEE